VEIFIDTANVSEIKNVLPWGMSGRESNDFNPRSVNLEPRQEKVLAFARTCRAERYLDIGCGNGSFSVLLRDALRANEVYGIEIVEKAAEEARKLGLCCVQLDIDKERLPFGDSFFDAVFAGNIIEHLLNPERLLEETRRVLKPGGRLLLTTDNLGSWHSRLHLLLGYQPYTLPVRLSKPEVALGQFLHPSRHLQKEYLDPSGKGGIGHVGLFTLRALKEALEFYGFDIRRVSGASYIPLFNIPWPLSLVVSVVEKVASYIPSLASYVIVEAVKGRCV
jgi:SAM-dependent methyltransferase